MPASEPVAICRRRTKECRVASRRVSRQRPVLCELSTARTYDANVKLILRAGVDDCDLASCVDVGDLLADVELA
jgi:hypothetical protein